MSLTMFSAVSRSISSAFFSPTAVWFATAPSSSASSSRELPALRQAAEHAELLVAGHQRRHQQRVLVDVGPQLARDPAPPAAAPAVRPPHQVEHEAGAAGPGAGRRGALGVGARQQQLVGLDVEAVDLAGVRPQQLARAARDDVVEVLPQGHRRQRLAELGEGGQRLHPAAGLLVELGVLDRPADQRGGVDEEVEHVVLELARRLGVEDDDPDHVAGLGQDRDRDHRLEVLLLELGHELHPRVRHRVLADELGGLGACDPAGEALVDAQPDLPDEPRVARRGGAQHQAIALEEVDEAGVAAGRVGGDVDDPARARGRGRATRRRS